MKIGTQAVWGSEDEPRPEGTTTQTPIIQSVSFGYSDLEEWQDVALRKRPGHIYSRNTNPTVSVFEEKVRLLEGAQAATSFASGMAAICAYDAVASAKQRIERIAEACRRALQVR